MKNEKSVLKKNLHLIYVSVVRLGDEILSERQNLTALLIPQSSAVLRGQPTARGRKVRYKNVDPRSSNDRAAIHFTQDRVSPSLLQLGGKTAPRLAHRFSLSRDFVSLLAANRLFSSFQPPTNTKIDTIVSLPPPDSTTLPLSAQPLRNASSLASLRKFPAFPLSLSPPPFIIFFITSNS